LNWIPACPSVAVAQYPFDVPYGTRIPRWVFQDVTSLPGQTYSDATAISVGRDPEFSPKPLVTMSTGTSTTISTVSKTPSLPSTNSGLNPNEVGGKKTNTAAIVGGVLGAAVVLIIIVIVVILVLKRQKRNRAPPQIQENFDYYPGQTTSPSIATTSMSPPYTTQHGMYGPQAQVRYNGMPEI